MVNWSNAFDRTLSWAKTSYGRNSIFIALTSSTITAFIILSLQGLHRRTYRRRLRDEIEEDFRKELKSDNLTALGVEERVIDDDEDVVVDDSLIAEQLTRNIAFFG